jgi:prepilin-type N-terminal cleavage/methylation domain-containing protein
MIMRNKEQKNGGFTLIEIMVAVSIFAMVMVIAIGAVLSIVSANKKAAALNSVITNLNFAIEGMMRDLRTGTQYNCGALGPGSADCPNGDSKIGMLSAQFRNEVGYGLGLPSDEFCPSGIYKVEDFASSPDYFCLTGPDIRINQLRFYVIGSRAAPLGDYNQPRIIIVINGNFVGYGALGNFSLQSSVSERKLDI